jgi:hypothetical protein
MKSIRKTLSLALGALALFIATWDAKGVDCVQSPPGLVAWWSADGSSLDLVGTNHAYLFAGTTATNAGYVNKGFRFDGTNTFAAVSNSPLVNLTNLTVECWVRFDLMDTPGTSTDGAQYLVFKKNTRTSIFEGINLSKHRYTNSDIIVWEASSASGQFTELRSKTVIQQGVWYHLAGLRGSNYLALFVNGVMESSNTVNYPQDYDTKALLFGASGEPYWEHKLAGMLDEIGLYNRALSGPEILAIYNAGAAGRCKTTAIAPQPQSQFRYWGSSVTFTSGASGPGALDFRWRKDDAPIAGATNSSLTMTDLQMTNAGIYTLVVTNSSGSVTSSPAALQMKFADFAIGLTDQTIGLSIGGTTGKTYGVRYSSDLNSWFGLTNVTLSAPTNIIGEPAAQPQRFYQLVPGPILLP